jgi:aromatic ring-cleaving dioxygenase
MARHAGRAAYTIDVSDCFPAPVVGLILPWLMLNRDGLSILLHPGTGDAYADHIDHAVWLGSVVPLRMNVLRKSRKTPSHS